jgi:hypothetical protein
MDMIKIRWLMVHVREASRDTFHYSTPRKIRWYLVGVSDHKLSVLATVSSDNKVLCMFICHHLAYQSSNDRGRPTTPMNWGFTLVTFPSNYNPLLANRSDDRESSEFGRIFVVQLTDPYLRL